MMSKSRLHLTEEEVYDIFRNIFHNEEDALAATIQLFSGEGGMKSMNNSNSKPKKKYHSKDRSTPGDNLPVTIAKLEAYSKLQAKENQTKEEGEKVS
jgi:hypothetical protein